MAFKSLQLFFLLLASFTSHVISRHIPTPIPQHLYGCRKGDNVEGIHSIKKYLHRYGYLSHNTNTSSHIELNSNTFDDTLESAVKLYQKWSKLNVSGILDQQTLDQIFKPRCGLPDVIMKSNSNKNTEDDLEISSHYALFPGNQKWPDYKRHLTYTFTNNFPIDFVPSVTEAMKEWAAHSLFTFSQAADDQVPDINISFQVGDHGDGVPFDGPGGVVGHAFAPTDGRLHLDGDDKWSAGLETQKVNVMNAALHELGHVLGLAHSTVQQAVMWPYIDVYALKALTDDDIAGLTALYP
ncbi:hypothetical protein IC582_020790 [Cucumis melo]|uniref:Metalloendoproteinase 2-MMP-like n=2 Tax=Cucumis melo TaxID=3656 RepID=A0A1S3C9J6_CUCME|nr:metalloendoproteinase 2-MMP-like [Cucumis melo]KAA0037468.1 metalloendoproteinase 2-MMP-like [Cucumis melo var. makuwa]TYK01944.1 metalloendoproteinase 2-MMP-like [Cucumis melo var. makuwa]